MSALHLVRRRFADLPVRACVIRRPAASPGDRIRNAARVVVEASIPTSCARPPHTACVPGRRRLRRCLIVRISNSWAPHPGETVLGIAHGLAEVMVILPDPYELRGPSGLKLVGCRFIVMGSGERF
jgi:hypothetical protein